MVESPTQTERPGSPGAVWALRLLDGPMAGSTWPLGPEGLVIGRGLGCQVRLDDPRVSRNHCELRVEETGPCLRNLSESNATLVNRAECDETRLQAGDVIEVASYRLMIAPGTVALRESSGDSNTTLSMSDALHSRESFDAAVYESSPDLTQDLHALFRLLRTLSRAESLDTLILSLRGHLKEHLAAQEVWVGWSVQLDGELALFPPASPEETREAPMDLMRECCRLGQGLLPPVYAPEGRAVLAAPLVHGASSFGTVVVSKNFTDGSYSKRQLNYLVSVAECTAPLVRAMERLEQLKRDTVARGVPATSHARMLGSSPVIERLRGEIRRAAMAKSNVLISGETGVGKELAARTLHDLSARASGPYVTVNCAAIPSELFESELFGHERGAFTGATEKKIGLIQAAHGGTLFLDEVGELSLPNQARLLRVVETGTFRRIGAEKELRVDVRIVSATNRPLPDAASSYFRVDLYHRLASVEISVPPLRTRRHDIPEIAQHYVDEFSRHTVARPRSFSHEAVDRLLAHDWPGNIRELRNVVERACFDATREVIGANELTLPAVRVVEVQRPEEGLDAAERRHILSVLEQNGWRVIDAAGVLGLSKSTMYYKLSKHRIDLKRR